MRYERQKLRWNGWGEKTETFDLRGQDQALWDFLSGELGLQTLPETPAPALHELQLSESDLDPAFRNELAGIVGAEHVKTDDYERIFHAFGRSYYDLIRIRQREVPSLPSAVVYPRNHAEVMKILAVCARESIAVTPFGGGSSVVGGVEAKHAEAHRASITLDTTRMTDLLDLDEVSHTATFQAGVYGPDLEATLAERGYTLGHYPQSFEFSTLGGWIAARGAGQQSNRYGNAAKLLVGARVATPSGELATGGFPASAAGPDLNAMVAGSEGVLGVITEASMHVHKLPASRDFISILFRDWESGALAIRRICQAELPIATMRLSDADETRFYGAFRNILKPSRVNEIVTRALGFGGFDQPCVLMIGFEGPTASVNLAWRHAFALCSRIGGLFVGRGPGRSWYENRFAMPYLRDPLMDRGVGVDTLETSTSWSNLHQLYFAVQRAIRGAMEARGHQGMVMTHISHSYADGASLYFTFIFPRDAKDEIGQWRAIKTAASEAISKNGGTISHHHGVGIDHAPWMAAEKGELGIAVLQATKDRLDPNGVMNPGKLLPSE